MSEIVIRLYKESDFNFVINSYLKRVRHTDAYKPMCNDAFYHFMAPIAQQIITNSTILVACNKDDDNLIYGYIIYENLHNAKCTILHMVYVKSTFRNFKIATNLLEKTEIYGKIISSIYTPEGDALVQSVLNKRVFYIPFLFSNYLGGLCEAFKG